MAIKNSKAEILLLADDDLFFVNNYNEIIKKAYEDNPMYDVIVFQVEGINQRFKNYYPKERNIGYIRSLKVSSVEISFKRASILNANISFNEMIGTGAKYRMGEENEFLYKCLRSGLKIKYIPIKIADLYIGDSSWFCGFNEKYFFDKGAVFTAMSKKMCYILMIQFLIRHYKTYRSETSAKRAIVNMIKGHIEYNRDIRSKK